MRISSVFEGRKKKSGGALITAFTVCLAISSSFLYSCTVKTHDDVKDKMHRIESGVENEKAAEISSVEDNDKKISLVPVSESVTEAKSTIDEWGSRNGMFKFDNCVVDIPAVSEFPEYKCEIDKCFDTAQKKYAQFKEIEKEIFG